MLCYNCAMSNKHRFPLYLPIELWQRVQSLAKRNRRPVTQEIILAIEAWLDSHEDHEPIPNVRL